MNRKVLIVDDQPEIRDGIARLMRTDYDVDVASSSEEALRKLRDAGPFAVIVTDHQMPGGDGVSLLERAREESPDTVRILMTGHADLEVAREATNRGEVFRFLEKPLPHEVLHAALSEGIVRYQGAESEAQLALALAEARESVARIVRELEVAPGGDTETVSEISDLAARIAAVDSLGALASVALDHGARILPGRGLQLDLLTGRRSEDAVSASAGPSMKGPVHREVLRYEEGEVGSLMVGGRDGRPLSPTEERLARTIASITCVATHNQIRRRQRDEAQHAIIFAMARLAETRDNETGQHLERVSSYAAIAAENLRTNPAYAGAIDDAFVQDLIRSAPLHDIGKVGIPDAILLKPGQLDREEWSVMRTHAQIGADILRCVIERTNDPVGFLHMALEIAWNHHEKWDGSGYPRGIAGKAIPLSARILSVVDCFDALTSRRPYKDPWPAQDAFVYLRENAGSQFDPDIVRSFLACEREVLEVCVRFADPEG